MPRPLALAILGAALLLRLLIPTGWMPFSGADGFRIVLCTPAAMAEAWPKPHHAPGHAAGPADHGAHHQQKHDKPAADQPCAFSGLAMAGDTPPPLAAVESVRARGEAAQPLPSGVTVDRGLAAPPPPSTGPPAFA